MKEIIISSEQQQKYCLTFIQEMKLDGTQTVILKRTDKSPTAKQRRLWYLWCREVAMSGLGQDDDTESVHIRAKWMFVRVLLLEQSEMFTLIYNHFMKTVETSSARAEQCQVFARDYISTESLTKENRIKSLSDFQRYWVFRGVNLTDPALRGIDLNNYK